MAIYTPRGLMIHVPTDWGFALMADLYPQVRPSLILGTVEAIHMLPGISASLGAIVAFQVTENVVLAGVSIVATYVLSFALSRTVWFHHVGPMFWVADGFSSPLGIIILRIWTFGVVWFEAGWHGLLTYVVARLVAPLIRHSFDFGSEPGYDGTTVTYSAEVRDFFAAYRRYARQFGIHGPIDVEHDSLRPEVWERVFDNYRAECPVAARRCSPPPEREFEEELSAHQEFCRNWLESRGFDYEPGDYE